MNKVGIFLSLFLLLFVVLLLVLPMIIENFMHNVAVEDSLLIDPAIKQKLGLVDTEIVYRYYHMSILDTFAEYDNLTDIMENRYWKSYYLVMSQNEEVRFLCESDGVFVPADFTLQQDVDFQRLLSDDIVKYIADDITVYNTYLLNCFPHRQGVVIYYVTNKGDFVYFDHWQIAEYLFPVEAFHQYQKAVWDENTKIFNTDELVGGTTQYRNIWDLSPYDFNSDTFDPYTPYPGKEEDPWPKICIIGSIGVLIVGAGAGVFVACKRKKKAAWSVSAEPTMEQTE